MLLIQKLVYLRITKGCPLRMNSTLLNLFKKTVKICTNLLLTISPETHRKEIQFKQPPIPCPSSPQPRTAQLILLLNPEREQSQLLCLQVEMKLNVKLILVVPY